MNRRDYIKTVALGAILPMASTYGYPFGLGELSRVKFFKPMAFVARYEVGRTSVLGKSITGLGDREREIEMFSSWEKQNFTFINASKSIRKLETYSKGWYYESMDWDASEYKRLCWFKNWC